MKIIIETIPHDQQRYHTVGDWWWEGETLHIRVSNMFTIESSLAVAVHELREATLCKFHEIKEQDVTQFDVAFENHRGTKPYDEPGDDPKAPYHEEHKDAEFVERAFIGAGPLTWESHCLHIAILNK